MTLISGSAVSRTGLMLTKLVTIISVEKRIVAQNKTNLLLQILCRNNQHVEDTNVEKGLS